MNSIAPITQASHDLVSTSGVFNDQHFLFRCEMVVLAGNIRTLLAEYELGRAALCQNIAVAYLRIQRGELGIAWATWCERFVRKPDGKPYSAATIATWLKIGMKPDVEAAWRAHCEKQKTASGRSAVVRLRNAEEKAVAYDRVERIVGQKMVAALDEIPAQSLGDRAFQIAERQFKVLCAAWEAADERVRDRFMSHVRWGVRD